MDVPCHTLELTSSFFDSLREGYGGFDNWFNNQCAKTGRRVWVCQENNEIQAICIYKTEQNPIVNYEKQGLPGKALKFCTFKVSKLGYKIGELLLKQAFNYAVENSYEYAYVTVEPNKHEFLEDLFLDYGFYRFGVDGIGRDYVYVKDFPIKPPNTNDNPLEYAIKYYPHIKVENNSIFLVPIQPQYHKMLFPELEQQADLFGTQLTTVGNALKQAYLCKSPIKSIQPGDILVFYRTKDTKVITTYGVVDQFRIERDPEKIYQWVSKRTVYTIEEIREMSSCGADVKIILFRQVRHLENQMSFKQLKEIGVIKGAIQSITKLNKDRASLLLHGARINDRALFN